MQRQHLTWLFLALGACGGGGSEGSRIPGYLTSDVCNGYGDEASCADAGCAWAGLESCPADTDCPEGVCYQPDPCNAHGDADSCVADTGNGCEWAAVELCPPDSDCSAEGFCYAGGGTDECVCVCPVYCPEGEDCPPCDCSCPPPDGGGGSGGGTCTCACPDCPEGETCPPCDCTCEDPGTGCSGEGTCTCVCPECPEGETCPPCDCDCDAAEGGGGTETCVCPECPPDQTCPACECQPSGDAAPPETDVPIAEDPCAAYTDEGACVADSLNMCSWIGLGIPCMEGETCVSGVCQGPPAGDGDCTCVCPGCDAEPCPLMPCTCECGTDSGCISPDPA